MSAERFELTIPQILEAAVKKYGDRTAMIDKETRLTYTDIDQRSHRLATQLYHLGIRKGDVVAAQLPNGWPYAVAHLAVALLGGIFLPLNLTYRHKELTYMFNHSETKAVFVIDEWKGFNHSALINEVKEKAASLQHVITYGPNRSDGDLSFDQLLALEPAPLEGTVWHEQSPAMDDTVTVMFTSGTEADPKAVLHTYSTFVPVHLLSAVEYGFTEQDVLLSLTPLSHMFAYPVITSALYNGVKQVMLDAYHAEKVLQLIEEEGVTFLIAAPAQMLDLLALVRDRERVETKLRMVLTGGSKIPAKMVQDFRTKFGCVIGAQWGMTEVGAGTFTRPDDPPHFAVETIGRPNPLGEIRIIGDEGQYLGPGEEGEIAYRGSSLFIEYYKNEKATQDSFTNDGFFLTGDLGAIDETGYVRFLGRKKDIVNRGGLKVHTAEVEEALLAHPAIRQAAVVAVPDERLGEKGKAIVSLRDGHSFTLEEMVRFMEGTGMAKYKIPEYLEIRDELPTTPSGKVKKGDLRREIETETGMSQ